MYARDGAVDAFIAEIFERENHLEIGQIIYPDDPLETHHTMHAVVQRWARRSKHTISIEECRFLLYCITYRGVGFTTYFYNAQIYQISRTGPGEDEWEMLRLGEAQRIT